uniref:Protein CUSTOS n=1 Tax=Loxodonta africana TaxID=9785 RepID=G3UM86_LOXAF
MAAPTGAMSDSDSSSSSDAEELARCREAAMPAWGLEQRPKGLQKPRAGAANNQLPATQRSLRLKVDEHEQDGNELQTTREFRAHVAKKLGALLDSTVRMREEPQEARAHFHQESKNQQKKMEKEPTKAKVQKAASEDDGFRLFFTSIPGDPEKETSPQPHRKRPPSSSSSEDSDEEWQRCREAAVSASDIFQESAIHGPIKDASVATATTTTSGTAVQKQEKEIAKLSRDQASLGTKKKKKAKTSEAPQFLPAKSAAAVLAN